MNIIQSQTSDKSAGLSIRSENHQGCKTGRFGLGRAVSVLEFLKQGLAGLFLLFLYQKLSLSKLLSNPRGKKHKNQETKKIKT